jgi:hypothetical protein
MKTKTLYEIAFIVMFVIALFVAVQLINDARVSHERPVAFWARDSFYSTQIITDTREGNGFLKGRAPYTIDYKTDSYYYRPPLFGAIGTMLSHSTGLNDFDIGYHLTFFVSLIMIALIYVMLRDISPKLAMISLPLTLLLYIWPFNAFLTAGHWPSTLNILFVIASILVYMHLKSIKSYVLFGLMIGAGMLSHTRETIYFLIFIFSLLIIYDVFKKKLTVSKMKRLLLSLGVGLVTYIGFIPYFIFTMGTQDSLKLGYFPKTNFDTPTLFNFHWFVLLLLVAGVVCFSILLYLGKKKSHVPYIFGIGFFIMIFSNVFISIGNKAAAQNRFFLPIVLAIFFGTTTYELIRIYCNKNWCYFAAAIVFIVLILATHNFYTPTRGPVIESYYWDGLQFLADNVPENDTVLSLFTFQLGHDAVYWWTKRNVHIVLAELFVSDPNTMENPIFKAKLHARESYAVRKGLFDFEIHNPNENLIGFSVCNYSYVLIQKNYSDLQLPTNEAWHVLNAYVTNERNNLIRVKNMTIAYEDNWLMVLYNKNKLACRRGIHFNETHMEEER